MIDQSTNIEKLLLELTKSVDCYYIKQASLISSKNKNGHYVYSHFLPVRKKVDKTLIKQHLNKELTIAISLKNLNALVFEYRGKEAFAFGTLLFRILKENHLQGKILEYSFDKLLIFIEFPNKRELKEKRVLLSAKIKDLIPQDWRILPIDSKPELGNLIILPREIIQEPW